MFVAVTPLGQLLFERLHHVTSSVGHMSQIALLFMCAYPLFDMTVSSPTHNSAPLLVIYPAGMATCWNTVTVALQQRSWYHISS